MKTKHLLIASAVIALLLVTAFVVAISWRTQRQARRELANAEKRIEHCLNEIRFQHENNYLFQQMLARYDAHWDGKPDELAQGIPENDRRTRRILACYQQDREMCRELLGVDSPSYREMVDALVKKLRELDHNNPANEK